MATGMKTHRGARKRFRKTATGYKRKQANHRHLLDHRSTKNKRNLRSTTRVHKSDENSVGSLIGE